MGREGYARCNMLKEALQACLTGLGQPIARLRLTWASHGAMSYSSACQCASTAKARAAHCWRVRGDVAAAETGELGPAMRGGSRMADEKNWHACSGEWRSVETEASRPGQTSAPLQRL